MLAHLASTKAIHFLGCYRPLITKLHSEKPEIPMELIVCGFHCTVQYGVNGSITIIFIYIL